MTTDPSIRIQKDITLYEKNLRLLEGKNLDGTQRKIIDLATRYCSDAQYYLKKEDFLTSFGCINYAHGLLDALIKF